MSNSDCTLTLADVSKALSYDSQDGAFYWRKADGSKGLRAGGLCSQGYGRIKIAGKSYKAHRLAWLMFYGEWPKDMIDHINGNRSDNRIANLRLATNAQNQMNRAKPSRNNQTGTFLGVNFNKQANAYAARIKFGAKRIHLGYFDTPEEAAAAYNTKKAELTHFAPVCA